MSKLIVTGAAGFIGARFIEACNRLNREVISVDCPAYFTERKQHHGVQFGEIIDREKLMSWLESSKPKISGIVHLGACTDTFEMDVSYLNRANFEYSQGIWNYCSQHKIPLVYASSAATYGNGEIGFDDDESNMARLKPLNPYGESKRLFDIWTLGEEKKGNHPPQWAGFKFFNVYGYGELHKEKMASLIPHAVEQVISSGKIRLFKSHRNGIADGHQKRDFIYVSDLIEVLFFALDKPIKRGIFNLGTGQARTFLDLAKAVFTGMGRPEHIEFIDTPGHLREHYQYFTEAKMEKLRAEGYQRPFTPIEAGVKEYVARLRS